MLAKRLTVLGLTLMLLFVCLGAAAEDFLPLPMDAYDPGPEPRDACYLSDTEYQDDSISVKIYTDRAFDTDYVYAHIKIAHPSQLRTMPASIFYSKSMKEVNFRYTSEITTYGANVAKKSNAVISINGDYFTKTEHCFVVLRQGQQVRNKADGTKDLLIIDKNGDFSVLEQCTKAQYNDYLDAHEADMYNVFCLGPVLAVNGESVIPESYVNNSIGAQKGAQRAAIIQLGPLEYAIVTSSSEQASEYAGKRTKDKGMTIYEFAQVCQDVGKRLNENGCLIAYNLDGGNSATINFKQVNQNGKLVYVKVNPGQPRFLSDIIYFATLVR